MESKFADLTDPQIQPVLRYDDMFYISEAEKDIRYRQTNIRLNGPFGRSSYLQVSLNLSPDGAMGAALASFQIAAPDLLRRSIQEVEPNIYKVSLYVASCIKPGTFKQVAIFVDGRVPATAAGKLLGGGNASWPFVLHKALEKLRSALATFADDTYSTRLSTWEGITENLMGRRACREPIADLPGDMLIQRLREAQKGVPAAVNFVDALDLAQRNKGVENAQIKPVLGGLGIRLSHADSNLDVVLLGGHMYSVLQLDSLWAPQNVLLYNPLGFNPSPTQLHEHSSFYLPEEICRMPKLEGAFWLPISMLRALGSNLYRSA